MLVKEDVEIEQKPLGIPYIKHGPTAHSYVNFRQTTESYDVLPELRDCPPMLDLVKALHSPDSPFETFGCDHGEDEFSNPKFPGFTRMYSSYLELAPAQKEKVAMQFRNGDFEYVVPKLYQDIVSRFRQYSADNKTYDTMHVAFTIRPTVSQSIVEG